ncbi:hypothetical protein BKA57DRAFT_103894 [Linnemannia elongata]|nr:hypothetical protein BKA57DRAFT_103894 [Linnemannia elongata]
MRGCTPQQEGFVSYCLGDSDEWRRHYLLGDIDDFTSHSERASLSFAGYACFCYSAAAMARTRTVHNAMSKWSCGQSNEGKVRDEKEQKDNKAEFTLLISFYFALAFPFFHDASLSPSLLDVSLIQPTLSFSFSRLSFLIALLVIASSAFIRNQRPPNRNSNITAPTERKSYFPFSHINNKQ